MQAECGSVVPQLKGENAFAANAISEALQEFQLRVEQLLIDEEVKFEEGPQGVAAKIEARKRRCARSETRSSKSPRSGRACSKVRRKRSPRNLPRSIPPNSDRARLVLSSRRAPTPTAASCSKPRARAV